MLSTVLSVILNVRMFIDRLFFPEKVSLLFLGSGIILAIFQSPGQIDFSKVKLIIWQIGRANTSTTGLSNLTSRLSTPAGLFLLDLTSCSTVDSLKFSVEATTFILNQFFCNKSG